MRTIVSATSRQLGTAAEQAFELALRQQLGVCAVWRNVAGPSARFNRDLWDLWDVAAITPERLIVAQVKATATKPTPEAIWLNRYRSWPHPSETLCLFVWLQPEDRGWRMWSLAPDGVCSDWDWTCL